MVQFARENCFSKTKRLIVDTTQIVRQPAGCVVYINNFKRNMAFGESSNKVDENNNIM